MSVWGTDEDAALAAVERSAPVARAPAKFSAWSAIPRGIAAAATEVFADFNTGRIQADPASRRSDFLRMPQMQADPLDRQKVGREIERTARDVAQSLRTDAADASVADQLLFDGARGLSKAVGAAVTMGPVLGAAAFGTSEGLATSDQLQRQGVDAQTARTAGAVTGVISAVGVGLPAAGRSLGSTAGLVAAGGPASFVAQTALTREILQRGGYQKQAEGYDPFDPVGLAVSTLAPLPFAALGMRAAKIKATADMAAGPVPSERTAVARAVDEVTMPRDLVDAAMVAHQGERLRAVDDAVGLMVRSAESARQFDSLAAFVARNGYTEPPPLPKPAAWADPFLAWVRAQGGIDIGEKLDITGEANGVRANPGGIFRRGGITTDDLASRAAAEGYLLPGQEGDTAAFVDLVKQAVNGDKVLTIQGQAEKAARDVADAQNAARLADLEDRLRLLGEDPAAARGNADAIEAYLAQNEPRLLRAALDEIAAARVLDDESPGMLAMQERAREIARDVQDGGRTVDEYAAEVEPLSPAMRRLVQEQISRDAARPAQAPDTARAAAPRGAGQADAPAGAADARRSAAGVEAARVAAPDPKLFPPVTAYQGVSVGPVVIEPRPVAAGRPVYRETNLVGLDDLMLAEHEPGVHRIFVSDNPDLAIGQGENRGVRITFRPDSVSGAEHKKPGTSDATGREYQTDLLAPRAIQSVEMAAQDVRSLRRVTQNRLSSFTREDIGGGMVRFTRRGLEPRQDAATAEPAARSAPLVESRQAAGLEASVTPAAKAEAAATAGRMDQLQAERPDMLVMLDGMESPMRLDEFLAAVRAEADEMQADAPLVQKLAECAIINSA